MVDNLTIIGGADGPTTVFLAGKAGDSWFNIFGLIFVVLVLIPNIIYAFKIKGQQNRCQNRFMNILEQIGRYGCMFLMVFNIGIAEFGFRSIEMFLVYLLGNLILIASYWIIWAIYFKNPSFWKQISLAVIPTIIFLLSGITMMHFLLIIFGIIFGVGHVYVTHKNAVMTTET